ncbi:hypothetical protein GF377_11075 [candidate division GN15 bacterium]|nr:hypothetical protein [candidate division GN15 bacterium]
MLTTYVVLAVLVVIAGIIFLLLNKPLFYGLALIAAPLVVVIVTHPKLAMGQFLFCLFIEYPLLPSVPLFLIDISAMLVIAAAVIDVLTSDRLPRKLPAMGLNYLYIFAAFAVTGILGYFPHLLPMRLATLTLLIATFFSLFRLMSHMRLSTMLHAYFGLAVVHGLYTVLPFVMAGGRIRAFGLAGVLFDDLMVIAVTLGVALYLAAPRGRAGWYLAGLGVVTMALIGTQSRLSIMFGAFFAVVTMVIAWRRGRREGASGNVGHVLRTRLQVLTAGHLFTDAVARFEQLEDTTGRYSTVGHRLRLWSRAWMIFLDHPILGLGPGGYYNFQQVYSTGHLMPMWYYYRTLGAHNVFLHYLAISGLIGGIGLLALMINQFRHARRAWLRAVDGLQVQSTLALYGLAILLLVTSLTEGNWMWGQLSFLTAFVLAAIAQQSWLGGERESEV